MTDLKTALRQSLRAQRRAIPAQQRRRAARALLRHWRRHRLLQRARRVALYQAMGSELDPALLMAMLQKRGVAVYLPRLERHHRLRFVRGGQRARLRKGAPQPPAAAARPLRQMDVLLLPLLGFDALGQRLGQGGGYYDRALARLRGARRPLLVGLAFAAQQVSGIPAAAHDQRLHALLSEREFRRFPR